MKELKLAPVENACCPPSASMDSACCTPSANAEPACCPPSAPLNASLSPIKALALFAALISTFLVSDYWLGGKISNALPSMSIHLRDGISFFISHSMGLIALLAAITYLAVFARTFIDAEKVRSKLGKVNSSSAHGLAAAIGVATPLCSCSAVPVFTGFVRSGVPVSQAISFLVASPLVNEVAVVLLATSVGWAIAGLYAATGFALAIASGLLLRRIVNPSWTEVEPKQLLNLVDSNGRHVVPAFGERAHAAWAEATETVKTTFPYILIGVGFGAAIHGWMPTSLVHQIVAWGPVFGVIAAAVIGIPLYSGIATVIPVITALHEKGMPMGTLLAFSMSVTALSLPEALLLKSVMKPKLLVAYFSTVAIGIIAIGIFFNLILGNA